jgi:hypothetical protein
LIYIILSNHSTTPKLLKPSITTSNPTEIHPFHPLHSTHTSIIQIILIFHNNVLKTRVRKAGHLPMVSIVTPTQRDSSARLHSSEARLPGANKLFLTTSNIFPQVRFSANPSQVIIQKSWLAQPGFKRRDSDNIFLLQRPLFHSTSRTEFLRIT